MTIASETSRVNLVGNGVNDTFTFTFEIYVKTDLLVYVDNVLQEVDVSYTIADEAIENPDGGDIVFGAEYIPALDAVVSIILNLPYTQLIDYVETDKFPAETHERGLDRLVKIVQQLKERIARQPALLKSSPYSDLTLPDPVASKLLAWKDDLSGIKNVEIESEGDLAVTEYIKTLLDDESVLAARATLVDNSYFPDPAQADQGDTVGLATIKDFVDSIGTSKKATIVLSRGSAGNTTTYTLTTSETIPSNITLRMEPGAILDGAGTLTQNGPFEAGLGQCFGSSITVSFGESAVTEVHPEWWYSGSGAWATAVQSALTAAADGKTKLLPDKAYAFNGSVTMPHRSIFDITGAYITSTSLPVIKASAAGTILGHGADIYVTATSGGDAAIEAADNSGVCGLNIYGYPHIHIATTDVADSIGVDASSFYKTYLELSLQNWETGILYNGANANCYYNTLQSPIIRCGTLGTGIKAAGGGVSGLTINSPFISGGAIALYGIHLDTVGSATIVGGYNEAYKADNINVRGVLLNDCANITLINHSLDSASTVANYAIGITGTSDNITLIDPEFSSGWATSTKLIDFTSGGRLNLLGGGYLNAFLFNSTTLPTLTDGLIDAKIANLTRIVQAGSWAEGYASTFENTSTSGDGANIKTASTDVARSSLNLERAVDGLAINMSAGGTPRPGIYIGSGTPEEVYTALPGSLYLNIAGGANVSIYVKESGEGNTGWIAK